jgi:cyclic beta-1,2-glucan synthetase
MAVGILAGYYANEEEARSALTVLRRRGFRRVALLGKTAGGGVFTRDRFPRRRALGALMGGALLGVLAGIISVRLQWPTLIGNLSPLIPGLACGLVGICVGCVWIRRSKYGVAQELLEDHARRLMPNEAVVILQAPVGRLHFAVAALRESGPIPPPVFALHPKHEGLPRAARGPVVPPTQALLRENAQRLAFEHRIDQEPKRSAPLLLRLEEARQWIHRACEDLSEASRLEQGAPPTAEWILDNEYVVESNARDAIANLPRHYYRQMPVLSSGAFGGLPRIYDLAWELVSGVEFRLDRENIQAFIGAYQSVSPLTIGELWAVPQMLRIALIEKIQNVAVGALTELREREMADFWANRLISANRRGSSHLFLILSELVLAQPGPSPHFVTQLVDHLYDEEAVLVLVQSWLERTFRQSLSELNMREQNRRTKDQISVSHAVTSLRQLALLDWRQIFENQSRVELLLRTDPSGVYSSMDFGTRDRYRRAVEELARRSGQAEDKVAEGAIALAARAHAGPTEDERRTHVGSFLIGEGRRELAESLHCRERLHFRLLHWVYRHHSLAYFTALGFFSAVFVVPILVLGLGGLAPGIRLLIALLLLIPASQLAIEVLNYLATRLLPPRPLAKMDFKAFGIPDAFRTLVVVPVLLSDVETIREEAEKLEVRYLANKESNLLFSLFTDYTDADRAHREDDAQLLGAAIESLEALNRRHGGERFLLFHRDRTWSESERKFIGWERKRGKLEELNRLIEGTRPDGAGRLVYVGNQDDLSNVRFVITLDSDTQLPLGAARRLIETLAHPLNRPRFDAAGRVLAGTYTVIQPRVSPSLPSTSASFFSRLFADAVGIDPYTRAVSDVQQDLTGEGSYYGKGIYDVRAFSRVLSGRFPDGRLLSHDLIEGAHVHVGLASDIELYDEFPRNYLGYTKRQHRWIRGDWQIAQWISSRIPGRGGRPEPNPLSRFNRWKILDNLRRSLVPAASLGLLLASWLMSPQIGWISTLVVTVQLLFQPMVQRFTMVTTRRGLSGFSIWKVAHDVLRAVVDAALLPHQTALALDAILLAVYRRYVSHRRMLQWTSAQVLPGAAPDRFPIYGVSMGLVSVFSVIMAWAVMHWMPSSLAFAVPWLSLWFLSPLVGRLLNLKPRAKQRRVRLPKTDVRFLRQVARRTWRYFADFVGAETSWLPPDNYQVSPQNQLAMRTSPTNIGLWMVSALAASDFGYITADQLVEKLIRSMETIGRLERFQGHLLNWYDVRSLTPLEPRYVSAVDSGNLLGALWVLEHGLEELLQGPVLDGRAFSGLRDTAEILHKVEGRKGIALASTWEAPPARLTDCLRLLRRSAQTVKSIADAAQKSPHGEAEAIYWSRQVEGQVSAWLNIADRYLAWVEILAEKTEEEVAPLGPAAVDAIRRDLSRAPSLADLANGRIGCIAVLQGIREAAPAAAAPLLAWLDRLLEEFSKSRWLAGEILGAAERLIRDCRALSDAINMRFLYDPERRLFCIGFNVSEDRLDGAYYDLLAAEARLGSFIAIARGDVPFDHWFSMSRPYSAVGRRRVLLSWTGTMFEYLMPLIFQRSRGNTLLDKAAREALDIQMAYGHRHRVPWGISESAFGDLDLTKTYQYRAFGVPELALKRGLEEKVVVAPYATLLAVTIAPLKTVRNLKRLVRLGLLGDYGYYEAIDFSRQTARKGERGVVVQAYMAHHQGMSLLSLSNFLHDGPVRRRFHADARVRAVEPLLHERVPVQPPLYHISTRERALTTESVGGVAPSVSTFDTPHTDTPKTQLLSNGRYGVMVTNAGGGYSQWGNHEITRWRSDRTRDSWGTFCYIHDVDTDGLWSTAYQPCGGEVEGYSASFALDRAVYRRTDSGIQTRTELVVSPEDDLEIRRVTLINRSVRTRRLDLTSYIELAMTPHAADRQHPAFNKLFIQTEAVPLKQALLAFRRPRGEDAPPIYVAHRLTLENGGEEALQFETDRRRFIGRGRTLANPVGGMREMGNTQGNVLDPILSLRRSLSLSPGQRVEVSLVLAAGETREHVLGLMDKYGNPHSIDRALDFAWAAAQFELRVLRIQPDEARRFQQLAGALLYPNPLLRSAAERIKENGKGQAGLWPYGISGDLPIALVTISEARDISLVRQMLQGHAYWRMHGLMADLVILNEETRTYERPLNERLEGLIQAHSTYTGRDRPGGIFLRSAEQIPAEDLTLLMAAASVVLVAARGPLPQQLGVPAEVPDQQEPIARKRAPEEPSSPLPFLELPYFNGLGGFTPDGREYAIYLGSGTHTPAPWVNVIANPTFGTLVSETGSGFTWYGNSQRNRLTPWSNDPVMDPASEVLYIRDEETGLFWTPTPSPIREQTAYRARHGAGYTVFEHNSNGIDQELTVFVPMDERGGRPIKLQRLRLKNDSGRPRTLSVTYYVEWVLGEHPETSQMHVVTAWDDDIGALMAFNRYHPEYANRVAFAAIDPPAQSYSGDRTFFLGRNRTLDAPVAMERAALSRRTGAGLDPCAALQVKLEIAPGAGAEITSMVGQAESLEGARGMVLAFRERPKIEAALARTKSWWDALLGTIEVHTPELAADFLINRWLLYQDLSCRIWGRTAFYQSGGAFGFRDQLQDVLALVYASADLAREHILLAASRQFREGDVQHWWHPPGGSGIRTRISDDLLWLPYVVAHYVRITGDGDILRAEVPFLDGPELREDQHELFFTPEVALERSTLFEHCRRAVTRGLTIGPHGLPLMGAGDWNDGMNLVGSGGKGESVWLAWFLVDVLQGMSELSEVLGRIDISRTYQRDKRALIQRIEQAAWDGEWYLRGIFDDGSPLGSSRNTEARIDSLPQSWAWLSGAAERLRAEHALESAWKELVRDDEGLVLLFAPPFDRSAPAPGYIQAYPPGVRENGGQYTHAALWLAMAMARRGDGTRAAKILRMLNPIELARNEEAVRRYTVEPYAVAADVCRLAGRIGLGGWSWYTGSAALMYRAWVEEILGLKVRGNGMRVEPVIPGWWNGFHVRYRHGEAIYDIQVENPEGMERGVSWVEIDGRRARDGVIPLDRGLVKHGIVVRMGNPSTP